jgi:hypothetical protein
MASAVALGYGLRLRSRRVRSGRSQRLSLRIAIVVVALAGGVGFAGVQTRTPTVPVVIPVDAATLDQQRFVAGLRPIHAQIQQSVADTGLLVATYQSGSIDKAELQRRLSGILASYRDASIQIDALDTPAALQPVTQSYRNTLGVLAQSGVELSKAYDDGDQGRVAAALARSLQATTQLHDLADVGSTANFKRS